MTQMHIRMKTKLHKTRKAKLIYAIITCAFIAVSLLYACRDRKVTITQYSSINRPAKVQPDYTGSVIPPNIAPLNFVVEEDGSGHFVRIYSEEGNPIEIFSRKSSIVIPKRAWHELLDLNRGRQLSMDVYVETGAGASSSKGENVGWSRFQTLTVEIAHEDIDTFLVYRKIRPGHGTWRDMGIYQRNLSSFDESTILNNGYFKHGCVNCHAFCRNRVEKMLLGIRSAVYGSSALLVDDGAASKIGTKFGYTSWHPSGRFC